MVLGVAIACLYQQGSGGRAAIVENCLVVNGVVPILCPLDGEVAGPEIKVGGSGSSGALVRGRRPAGADVIRCRAERFPTGVQMPRTAAHGPYATGHIGEGSR